MTTKPPLSEYLVISRGKWDADKSPQDIQAAIDDFYVWYEQLLVEGRMKPGQRLAKECRTVSRHGITDGPFTEAKEVVGGYWFIMAGSIDEAARLAAANPCAACGLFYEVRPTEVRRGSAFEVTSETPGQAQG